MIIRTDIFKIVNKKCVYKTASFIFVRVKSSFINLIAQPSSGGREYSTQRNKLVFIFFF